MKGMLKLILYNAGQLKSLYLCCFVILCMPLNGQISEYGIPRVKNIPPGVYEQESQNFSVIQSSDHLVYFGNVNGIMEYDNSEWRLISIPGKTVMDINNNNEIFFGAYNLAGKIVNKNGLSKAHFFDISTKKLPGQINQVICIDDKVYFAGAELLLKYENGELKALITDNQGFKIFRINNELLIHFKNRGIYKLDEGKAVPAKEYSVIRNRNIADMYSLNDNEVIIKPANEKGFLIFDGTRFEKFNTEADEFIQDKKYSVSKVLSNGNILIGTEQGGLVCIDDKGKFLYVINSENALRDNFITDIFLGYNDLVWVTTYNGIAFFKAPAPFSFFDNSFGITGAKLSIIRKNEKLFIATHTGVFRYNYDNIFDNTKKIFNNQQRFVKIDGISSRVWDLTIINNNLFAAGQDGVFLIENDRAFKILEGSYNVIKESQTYEDICFIGGENGLLICNIIGRRLDTIGYLKGLNYEIRTISEDKDGTIWLGTNQEGAFKIDFGTVIDNEQNWLRFNEENAFPKGYNWVDVYASSIGTLFSTQKGLFHYDKKTRNFVTDKLLGIDFEKGDKFLYPIVEDENHNIWFSCNFSGKFFKETGFAKYSEKTNTYEKITSPFSILREFTIESIFPEKDRVWFGTAESLVKFKVDFASDTKTQIPPCIIRKVTIKKDSVIYLPPDLSEREEALRVSFSDKTIRFDFSFLNFNIYGENEYKVYLKGFDDSWSDWSKETFKEYTALKEKEYVFKVKARDIYGNISETASISFRVSPPIYRTFVAYLFYLIIFLLFIYLILKFNELNYAKERHKLEKLVEARTKELAEQKEQTEKLVRKLLPYDAANEIKQSGEAKSKNYQMVSVLFADIQGFTKIADEVPPEDLIKHLNNIFSGFDEIIGKFNIQKIKTIGDAYMCTGGMPDPDNTNPVEVVLAGLEMQELIKSIREKTKLDFKVRIGIHSGSVVAGVIGAKKLEYDIWGDTVNIASRMESNGVVDRVNVSNVTYNLINEFFDCKYREKIPIKYKGEMDMYLVLGIKPELASEKDKIKPNNNFIIKLQHLKLKAIQQEILSQLEKNLPKNLYYHNIKHTLNVLHTVEYIASKEKVSEEDLLLLKCAALFHDAGFLVSYDNNEVIGADMAEQTLRKYNFSKYQIETVKRLIIATQMPPNPSDLLEQIICDADLDYLGRPDFLPESQNLFRELFERGKINTIGEWNKMQYRFMLHHNFYTETARKKREPIKKIVLKELENLI